MSTATGNRWAAWLRENEPARYNLATKQGWDAFVHAAPRTPLERLSRTDMTRLSEEELEDYNDARSVWNANPPTVQTVQLSRAYSIIDQVMASGRRDADKLRGAVVIDAAPALGKTTIATRYARDFHRKVIRRHGPRTPEGHQRLPVAYLPLSAGTTLKGMNTKLLRFYGHPAATRATRGELGALAVDCVTSCQTQVIVIDDLHFIDFKHRHGQEVSNHLKGLANEMPVTFLYVGVRLREKKFFDEGLLGEHAAYAQTSRRATRCEVAPFTITTTPGARAWTALLAALEQHVLLADAHPGMLTDHAQLLHRRTQGCIGSLTNLLDRACYLAIATSTETITADLIETVTTDNAAQTLASTS
ncbi:AAA family ATPase [Ornithinimicrobium flavum]|uniref:AAA family ATPase n=1 Tax=Ornithinimicrobium flavum TaxID=1288636 RepID=UPI00106FF3AB|nr:TniB family NTP-binding protein [Ornithinimicrobium flavum]